MLSSKRQKERNGFMDITRTFYSDGVRRDIILGFPDGSAEGPFPVVLLCHGHSRHKNDGLDALSQTLNERGIATARFDFRGCCSGEGRYSLNCSSEWPRDLINAISYVNALPDFDRARIGVAGISMGAATAVYVTWTDARIRSTVSMGGISDCYQWMRGVWARSGGDFEAFKAKLDRDCELAALTGQAQAIVAVEMYNETAENVRALVEEGLRTADVNAYVTLPSLRNMMDYRPIERCARISTPVFFLHGGEDRVVPVEESRALYEAIPSKVKKLKVYPGMEHNIPADPNRAAAFEDIADWFLETL
jgi:dipeptidyl aminopeptidase/acylaminoacyl peptidase